MQFNKGDIVTCTDDDMYGITDKDVRCTVLSYSPELHDSNCHGSCLMVKVKGMDSEFDVCKTYFKLIERKNRTLKELILNEI